MTTLEMILIGACVVLVLIPPRYDPLIRWKERMERERFDDSYERNSDDL